MRNELKRVEIPVKLGEDHGCAVGHLLVEYKGEIVGIQEYSRMVVPVTEIKMLNCSKSPVFLKMTANLFIGNQGQGLEILHIENKKSEYVGQKSFLSEEKVFSTDFNKTIDIKDFRILRTSMDRHLNWILLNINCHFSSKLRDLGLVYNICFQIYCHCLQSLC